MYVTIFNTVNATSNLQTLAVHIQDCIWNNLYLKTELVY